MRVALVWLAVLLVAGCAVDNSPQGVCARRADDDPAVKEMMMVDAGSPWLLAENQDALKRARKAATTRCLQAAGLVPPGGVEQVIPVK